MPDILRMLGIVPRVETGAYGPGRRSRPALDIPQGATEALGMGTEPRSWDPIASLQSITDIIEPQKGAVTAAAKGGALTGTAKLAALLGIGIPKRYPHAPGQIDIPFTVSTPSGKTVESSAGLYAPEDSTLASFDALGDVAGMQATHGGRSQQSETTLGLMEGKGLKTGEGLQNLMKYIGDYLPKHQFMKHGRAGGVKGSQSSLSASVGTDLQAVRNNRPVREVVMREHGTAKRPLTEREKEFHRLVDDQVEKGWRFEKNISEAQKMAEDPDKETQRIAAEYLEKQFGVGKKKR